MSGPVRRAVPTGEASAAARRWWDEAAAGYQQEHAEALGAARFVWGPEGLEEADAGLLGDVAGLRVLELGCGAAQCARWLLAEGAVGSVVGVDLSYAQLVASRSLDAATGVAVPAVQADAVALPFAAGSFDVVCSAYGAVPFVPDQQDLHAEVARVLRPGGRWVFSVTHPIRWALPDDPGPSGLVVRHSYFDRTPYVEEDDVGTATYVEVHRTIGDRVRELRVAGFELLDLVEPAWPEGRTASWDGWSRLRGRLVPGTAVFVSRRRRGA